ncbi:MAG: carboxypeptidase regulatory-like domain-containing protein [Candidatus Cloacimonetes bacterium]|nr:carboxypeptidase regulatory-like domain-containing protein [Candidatus Cloacimonadota bacterium]MCB5287337.1 carboxypeptidase regulatory-like domain-containing protein [Candidatus Cloacimonadota bacterium]MCK9183884.1 carboxypeptidase regulatory-like domain-containing protein [Candidatus Cloacimonadota bacterium]MCK9583900.1 carboxypeptidase regulatory-like domain-containing protein [Candidatus Cloacimonadota bacterium]MDY0229659.1 carboxypeptidase regulatory-like domain-containing protein [
MRKCLLKAMLVAMFMLVAAFAWGQSAFYSEPFDTNQGWTLGSNWSITGGALQLSWSPSTTNYDLCATSPDIIVPVSAGDLVVSHYVNDYVGHGNPPETFEIIAVAGGVSNVLWSYSAEGDWGVTGGENLTLSLAPFAGQTIQLKFRSHGETTFNYNYWYIYDIVAYASLHLDLAAISLSGAATPSVGSEQPYVVSVRNTGITTVSDYTVKLMQTGIVELSSVAGTTIAPQQIIEFTIPWTPTVSGETQIWGKVEAAGDGNPNNNETAPYSVNVMDANLLVVEIGTDYDANTSTGPPTPYGTWYKAFRQQFLYKADDFYADGAIPGMISALAFNVLDLNECRPMPNFTIRLKHTNLQALGSTFQGGAYTTVWQRASFLPNQGWNIHGFDEPFLWDGSSNLLVDISTDVILGSYTNNALVYCSATDYPSSLRFQSDTSNGSSASSGTSSTNRSNIRFFLLPDGVGHITGTVQNEGGSPLAGVLVNVDARLYTAETDAQGQFAISNILPNDFTVNFSRHSYVSQSLNITLEGGETEELNVTMNLMAQVAVTGNILASDTGGGIAGAMINLIGYENYSGSSASNGSFALPTVFADQSYTYTISAAGYSSTSGTIAVGGTNHDMGNIALSEIAYAPNSVEAEVNVAFNAVNLAWHAPDPNSIEITESFEGTTFPPTAWSQIITNAGAINPIGVFPTWCNFGTINISGSGNVAPTQGSKQAGLWWDYTHQDEWLFTPSFNCPPDAYLSFDTYAKLGTPEGGHYYVKISSDGGSTWTVLWDASSGADGQNHYELPITIDLAAYAGMQVKMAFQAQDPDTNDGLWNEWFIDNLYIGNFARNVRLAGAEPTASQSINSSPITPLRGTNRTLIGYKAWRLTVGQENNESSWTSLSDEVITTLNFEDQGWTTIPNGNYKWAIKAVYTADVISAPALSNSLIKAVVSGNIVGLVRKPNYQGLAGATVTASGGFSATTNSAGAYIMSVPAGIYTITASAAYYDTLTQADITVTPNQNTTVNFVMNPTANEDEIVPIAVTALKGNYPNPFNPETTISYELKDSANVSLAVYNVKGQLLRSLVNCDQVAGRYQLVFNGRDDKGNPLSSGIYLYRFTAGAYSSTRKMMLME